MQKWFLFKYFQTLYNSISILGDHLQQYEQNHFIVGDPIPKVRKGEENGCYSFHTLTRGGDTVGFGRTYKI